MTYRVRKQAITGKLVLQTFAGERGWVDTVGLLPHRFVILHPHELLNLQERIAKYERRAEAQRNRRKAPPAAQAASAKESEPC